MSAWLVSDEHVDLLLTAAQVYSERQPDGAFTWDASSADAAGEENNLTITSGRDDPIRVISSMGTIDV